MTDNEKQIDAKLLPNLGIIGICPRLEVYGGYDGRLDAADIRPRDWIDEEAWDEDDELPKAEKLLLADMMIRRWTDYRNAVNDESDRA